MRIFNGYHFTGIIPARYASSRFPGKPLAEIGGKPMIRRVYEQASKSLDTVYVATDDTRIYNTVLNFGGKALMTSPEHQSGTDRCAEAVNILTKQEGIETDVVINIQGDEPFIRQEQINRLISCFSDKSVVIATLVRKVQPGEDVANPNHPKAILDLSGNAIYFTRNVIPYIRNAEMSEWTLLHTYYKHIGMYAYKTDTLNLITSLPQSSLEKAESLEQNRWLENGFKIRTAVTEWESVGIDTPEDLEKAKKSLTDSNKNTYL
jgi:3-deoxy-manno-octulosonate cytidylyltransferase (CMP-KDO synthetase)